MPDPQLDAVVEAIKRYDPGRIARILRDTLDQLYDGQHTGRYKWDQLYKTEKTHCGTLIEINLQKKLRIADGNDMDYSIAGQDVDCKYSQGTSWMIPLEAIDHLCLLVSANDQDSTWKMGVIRASESNLSGGRNRDSKRQLTLEGRKNIAWVYQDGQLPPNLLLQLDQHSVQQMMDLPTGQQRVNRLFVLAQGKIVPGAIMATVAQQKDYMKRLRGNGGARQMLKPDGIVILGQFAQHRQIANQLGLPVPGRGDSISTRLAPVDASGTNTVELEGRHWRVATDDDDVVPAPSVPHSAEADEEEGD